MGEAKSTSGTKFNPPAPEADSPSGPLSPIRVFVGLVVLLIVAGTIIYVTKPEASVQNAEAGLPESNNFALTDAEAITRFKELQETISNALRSRDVTVASGTFTAASPVETRLATEISQLREDRVFDHTQHRILDVQIIDRSEAELKLRETSLLSPCFVTRGGNDVTESSTQIRQTGIWTLTLVKSEWRIQSGVLTAHRSVEGSRSDCP